MARALVTCGSLLLGAACAPAPSSPAAPAAPASSPPPAAPANAAVAGAPLAGSVVATAPSATVAARATAPDGCAVAPKGMVCIPAGPAVIGEDGGEARERPRHTVTLGTYYLDRTEVTNADYAACEQAGGCPKRTVQYEPAFMRPDHPAVPLSWHMAHAYCRWAGKRLPSEAEWEKAARGGAEGRRYPWGDEPPSCARMQYVGCPPATTLPVGSLPAGAYGLFDLAGNGYEWVQDWESGCYEGCGDACGADCAGHDPRGPCGGTSPCKDRRRRMLKGGSWFWPAEYGRGAWRRPEKMDSGPHRLSVRCASSTATLATWPPLILTDPPPPLATPTPPSAAELAVFGAVPEEPDVLKIKLCAKINEAQHDCRDPHSYVVSNEPNQQLWRPFIENLGGGYVGIGADQSYSFVANARSRWAWIFDYDPAVVRVHYLIRALVLAHDSRRAFVDALAPAAAARAVELTRRSLAEEVAKGVLPASELDLVSHSLGIAGKPLHDIYWQRLVPKPEQEGFDWLGSDTHYQYVRTMFQQGRILIRMGNLLTDVALPSIAAAARRLGVPVRVLYTSNADDQWSITPRYRENLRGLPFDERSVVLRTNYPRDRSGPGRVPWSYVVHDGLDFQRAIAPEGVLWMWSLGAEGRRHEHDLVTIALPGKTER